MRVLVCPDKFAGTLSAEEAAAAMAEGWSRSRPGDQVSILPLSDGGPGFVDVLHSVLGGTWQVAEVADPLGRPIAARWLQVGDTAFIEAAAANGLHLLTERDPVHASTTGVGQLIAAARHLPRIVVGLGGSATNDGGRGAVEVLGREQIPGLVAAADVRSVLLGPTGATYGFARQKGAGEQQLPELEERMRLWSRQAPALAEVPGAGAAGGLGFGLLLLGAQMRSGAQVVAEAVGLTEACALADLVITGEGRLDWQSLTGKVVSEVLEHSNSVLVVAGQCDLADPPTRVISVLDEVGADRAFAEPAAAVADVAARTASDTL